MLLSFMKLFVEVTFNFKSFEKDLLFFINFFSNLRKLLNFCFKSVFIFFNLLIRLFVASSLRCKLTIIIKIIKIVVIVRFYYLRY